MKKLTCDFLKTWPRVRTVRVSGIIALALWLLLAATAPAQGLLLCGADEVFEIDAAAAEKGMIKKLWSWRAKDRADLPEELRKTFASTDDCKPIENGTKVLISSSSGGCALVERPSGKVLWYARVANAHSIELLPRNRVVVAASVHATGNKLAVFDLGRPMEPLCEAPLISAHGVVWDAKRQRLWALGMTELESYELADWAGVKPALKKASSHAFADESGHDLQAVPGSDDLLVTAHEHVFLFDREKRVFRKHPELGERPNVKGVSFNAQNGRVVYVPSSAKQWWTEELEFLKPVGKRKLTGEKLYKARWLPF